MNFRVFAPSWFNSQSGRSDVVMGRMPDTPSASIGASEMVSRTLPLTSTFDGAESEALFPSKMRTFFTSSAIGGVQRALARTAAPNCPPNRKVMKAPRARTNNNAGVALPRQMTQSAIGSRSARPVAYFSVHPTQP